MIILCCGSRDWTDRRVIWDVLRSLTHEGDIIVHGGCRGADQIAGSLAKELGLEVRPPYYADWKQYGLAAGPIRNQEMLDQEHPDLVLAFHDDLTRSKGTKDMLQRARDAGVEVKWFRHEEGHAPE